MSAPESPPAPAPSLLAAKIEVQRQIGTLPKDATNPFFNSKYTPLPTMVEAVTPLMVEQGLVFAGFPTSDEHGKPALRYKLAHVSGEAEEDTMPLLLAKEDSQGLGSAITYARRYALSAVLNLVSEADDDGNANQAQTPREGAQTRTSDGTVNLTNEAKGLSNGALNVALRTAGLPPSEKPWSSFIRVPPEKEQALREALTAAHAAEGR